MVLNERGQPPKGAVMHSIYKIGKQYYTIEELRQGYRVITGLNNDHELDDRQIFEYMANALNS